MGEGARAPEGSGSDEKMEGVRERVTANDLAIVFLPARGLIMESSSMVGSSHKWGAPSHL